MKEKKKASKRKIWVIAAALLLILAVLTIVFLTTGYHADESVAKYMVSDETVTVTETDYGCFFDGPSTEDALIFYPGGRVEETAYAPLLNLLARRGMDVCMIKMPFRLAVFNPNAADEVLGSYDYERWYIGGHSLGGAMATDYASKHADDFSGVLLFAAYPMTKIPDSLTEITVIGSEDEVVNPIRLTRGQDYASSICYECVIEGGNHAGFGYYGEQSGDGKASISQEQQIDEALDFIADVLKLDERAS